MRALARFPETAPQMAPDEWAMRVPSEAAVVDPLIQLQRAAGNQAVQRMLRAGEATTPSDADGLEEEASRVSEHVMRMPVPEHVPGTRTAQANAPTPSEPLPGMVQDVVNSPGDALDPSARAFFERRLARDLRHVRIHADAAAAESADAVDARAYAVDRHIVFGAGRYAPGTFEGRELLAHELIHVLHHDLGAHSSPGARSNVLHRQPKTSSGAERQRERSLDELAKHPGHAHRAWKRLSEADRNAVLKKMEQRYGVDFAQQFLEAVKTRKPRLLQEHFGRGVGPAPERLLATGYRRGWTEWYSAELGNEFWVHPSGKVISRDISTWKSAAGEPEKKTTEEDGGIPAAIDPHADREKLFGRVIALKVNVDAAFGVGDMVLYDDGTAELFLEGTGGTSYVFVPLREGRYAVYGPDGRRVGDKAWEIPLSDFPDPEEDSVD